MEHIKFGEKKYGLYSRVIIKDGKETNNAIGKT